MEVTHRLLWVMVGHLFSLLGSMSSWGYFFLSYALTDIYMHAHTPLLPSGWSLESAGVSELGIFAGELIILVLSCFQSSVQD